jgi:hypothetical protein
MQRPAASGCSTFTTKNWRRIWAKGIAPVAASTCLLAHLSLKPAASITVRFDVPNNIALRARESSPIEFVSRERKTARISRFVFALSADTSKILRTFAHFLPPKGTGESKFRLTADDSCSILSVENRLGALHPIVCQ